ncbi:hypothetical protein [Actinoalloteichus hymeniacidonis]|uniref:DUF4350 domain-containing protein n=1 Tax=Actinoalloteichus hymeniacidonis TaxID=340345 RepID=A0AAC9HRI7_9PSEU|nr:hypothetical protein [Actinoalloteichus hymeniacidonis]AOS64029.1 hypothetical protein TL08_16145 [Actinoalloteichus hymeniacidonis]MBB5907909.1 hypothetical protein [Actinoalloteichus hymeniacidonis]
MTESRQRRLPSAGVLRWGVLLLGLAVLAVFLFAQVQSVDVSYGQSPSEESPDYEEGSAGELSGATVPTVSEMEDMLADEPVVRLPGAVAYWDTEQVAAAIGDDDVRIIVAPPGLDDSAREAVRQVNRDPELDDLTVRIIGTEITGSSWQASNNNAEDWRDQYVTGDVTTLLVTMISKLRDVERPESESVFAWREPTDVEISEVLAELDATGAYIADDATLDEVPIRTAGLAFPDAEPLYVMLPPQQFGEPVPRYAPAVAESFPDRPVIVMYGSWPEYAGPDAEEFADLAVGSMFGQLDYRLSRYDYPQDNVLGSYLNRITDIRYAGLFDRPLPYQPLDPLRVALPALPWVFAVCVLAFLVLSIRTVGSFNQAPRRTAERRLVGPPARLAGLTALAIEISGLTDGASNPALTRAITRIQAAQRGLSGKLPLRSVHRELDVAETELDEAARLLGRPEYRPGLYLQGGL